jgi:uncharacterized protein YjbJ (UPF0337 family)
MGRRQRRPFQALPLTGDDLGAGQGSCGGIGEEVKGAVKGSGWQVVADAKLESEDKADKAKVKVQNAVGGLEDVVRDAVKK